MESSETGRVGTRKIGRQENTAELCGTQRTIGQGGRVTEGTVKARNY